jgi:hypothetical protein
MGATGPNYVIPDNPVYDNQIASIADTDPVYATGVVNPLILQIITNIEAVRQGGSVVSKATIAATGWQPGTPDTQGSFWYEYTLTDEKVSATDVIIMLPADGDSAVEVADYLRGYIATTNGGITLYARSAPPADFDVYYTINKGVS